MTYKYLIIILFMSAFMFMGFLCCQEKIVEEKRLTDIQKAQNPFKGHEKLIFITADSTIEFTGTERKNWTEEYDVDEYACEHGLIELDRMEFAGNSFRISLNMQESKYYGLTIGDTISDFYFYTSLDIDKTDGSISNYDEYIDRLYINDILCFNIYKDTLHGNHLTIDMPDSIKYPTYLYYSTNYGIVKFDFSDGSTWELKEIVW
jgi:hypothetical protein